MTDTTPPEINPLVIDVDYLARRLGLDSPVDSATADILREAILDAQADVEGYLNRPIVPQVRTLEHQHPYVITGGGWLGGWIEYDALSTRWRQDHDVLSVLSVTPEVRPDDGFPTGLLTISYLAGLDARNDPELRPILRYVTAAARNDPAVLDVWSAVTKPRGQLTSVSTDGQTASFSSPWHGQGTTPGSGAPGALPLISSLFPWKRQPVYQRREDPMSPGPWGW